MANQVAQTFRLPEQVTDLHDAIEVIKDADFLSLRFTEQDASGKIYAILTSKTAAGVNPCICAYYRLPDQMADLETYIETLDDAKFLAQEITPRDAVGKMYAFVISKT